MKLGELTARLHLDFDANAKYISFFIPEMPDVECPEAFALNGLAEILKWPETQLQIQAGIGGEKKESEGKPFFIWHNTTRMHVFTYISPKYQALMNEDNNYGIEEAGMAQILGRQTSGCSKADSRSSLFSANLWRTPA